MPVSVRQGGRYLPDQSDRLLHRKVSLSCEPVAETFSPYERHDVEKEGRTLALLGRNLTRVVQRQDMGMGEPGGDPDLAGEPFGAEQRAQLRPEDFERHLAVMLEVIGQIDGGHPAPPELPLHCVAARQSGGESGELIAVGHTRKYGGRRRSQGAKTRPVKSFPTPGVHSIRVSPVSPTRNSWARQSYAIRYAVG